MGIGYWCHSCHQISPFPSLEPSPLPSLTCYSHTCPRWLARALPGSVDPQLQSLKPCSLGLPVLYGMLLFTIAIKMLHHQNTSSSYTACPFDCVLSLFLSMLVIKVLISIGILWPVDFLMAGKYY